jgi:hypothetical protein
LLFEAGFRAIADREPFGVGVGETIIKTRPGLIAPNTTPLPPAANSDITSGLTDSNYSVEQFTLAINQYAQSLKLNIVTSKVAIQEQFLLNAGQLGYAARLTLDLLALQALFNGYMGGNTRVIATLGSAGPTKREVERLARLGAHLEPVEKGEEAVSSDSRAEG